LALVVGFAPTVADAQNVPASPPEGVTATASFREPTATIGGRLVLVVRVEHPVDMIVTVPLPSVRDAEVLNAGETVTSTEPDGSQVSETTFRYQVFTLGAVQSSVVTV